MFRGVGTSIALDRVTHMPLIPLYTQSPPKTIQDLQAQYESAAPIQQPAPAATATAARPRSARSTATTASAASVSPPGAAIHRRRGASPPVGPSVPAGPVAMAGGGARDVYGGGREAYGGYAAAGQRRRQGAYGALCLDGFDLGLGLCGGI